MSRLEALRETLGPKRIVVMLGGLSGEREVSLRSGANVLAALERQGIAAVPLDPADEDWIDRLLALRPDAVFLALHGRDGEDGKMQGFLETLGLRYTGSGVLASAIAMDKVKAKQVFQVEGLPTPPYIVLSRKRDVRAQVDEIAASLGFPLVVKPTSEGSSLGVSIVHTYEELFPILNKTYYEFGAVFAEQFIHGMEITIGVLGVGKALRALPVLELVPRNEFYDYEAKYTHGATQFFIPARLTDEVTATVQEIAVHAHEVLGCHGFSRVDLMITPKGEPFITEVNTLPGLTDLSDLPAQAHAAGISYDELILEILMSAFVSRLT